MTQPGHVQTSRPDRKLGWVRSDPDKPRLRLSAFLKSGYTGTVPATIDYGSTIPSWTMSLNDQLGCCTSADAAHQVAVWTDLGQGHMVAPTDQDVLRFYEGSTGYDPADPSTDQGGNLQDVCAYFRKTGMAGHKVAAYFQVDPADDPELRAALYLFGGVAIGFGIPSFAMDQFDAGKPWDISGRNTAIEGGHDVLLVGSTKGGNYQVVTWGRLQQVTPAFWSEYMAPTGNEAWARASQEWVKANQSPPGLDVAALNAAFMQLTGEPGPFQQPIVPPIPTPTPPAPKPNPKPVSAVDKALAAAMHTWLTQKGL